MACIGTLTAAMLGCGRQPGELAVALLVAAQEADWLHDGAACSSPRHRRLRSAAKYIRMAELGDLRTLW